MSRLRSLAAAALAAAAILPLLLVLSCRVAAPELDFSDHNLLLITIDTLRADRLGSYGYDHAETPNLDRLAAEGVRFENAYSPVPLTLPTHSTLFTGQYPFTTGVRINGVHYLDEAAVTLAEQFRDRDFDTAAFVSAYVLTSKFGLDQGFDEYEDSLDLGDNLFRFTSEIRADETYRRFSAWLADWKTKEHSGRAKPRRFFSWIHFYDPHLPYDPPAPYAERFPESPYDGEIAFVDYQVGKILANLEGSGLLDSTLIVVTSDHGEAFGEHVEEGHGLLTYNETLRVPLIVYAPEGLSGGRVIPDPVGIVEVAPTLAELCGLEPGDFDGGSLVPLLEGAERPEPSLYFESLAGVDAKNWAPRTGIL
ncbi:MAG: sulfatase, partial [bacterium]|nr:sulfatase [bacterium]